MILTLRDITDIYSTFSELAQKDYPIQISYWIAKNIYNIKEDYEFFIQKRNQLYDQYLQLDDNHSYVTQLENGSYRFNIKDIDQTQDFVDKFNQMLDMKCEIEPFLIKLDTLMEYDIQISPYQLNMIKDFILE